MERKIRHDIFDLMRSLVLQRYCSIFVLFISLLVVMLVDEVLAYANEMFADEIFACADVMLADVLICLNVCVC